MRVTLQGRVGQGVIGGGLTSTRGQPKSEVEVLNHAHLQLVVSSLLDQLLSHRLEMAHQVKLLSLQGLVLVHQPTNFLLDLNRFGEVPLF